MKASKYTITDQAHELIRATYLNETQNGEVRDLSERLKLPVWKISRYAVRNGWVQRGKKEPNWSTRELEILERFARLSPERIQIRLKAAGFARSLNGIVLKRKRMRMLSNLEGQSARSLADCLGVDVKFVTRAIQAGRLKAKRRGTDRTGRQGGDMWHIKDKHIRSYILENVHEIDFRKVDKYWFTDIVAGRAIV